MKELLEEFFQTQGALRGTLNPKPSLKEPFGAWELGCPSVIAGHLPEAAKVSSDAGLGSGITGIWHLRFHSNNTNHSSNDSHGGDSSSDGNNNRSSKNNNS